MRTLHPPSVSGTGPWPGDRPTLCGQLRWMASDSFQWLSDGYHRESPALGDLPTDTFLPIGAGLVVVRLGYPTGEGHRLTWGYGRLVGPGSSRGTDGMNMR